MNTKKPKSMPTETRTASSTDMMVAMVTHLTKLSCWFEVTPIPDDRYEITVKSDVAHAAFPNLKPYSVLLMRLDHSNDPEEYTGFMHVIAASVADAEAAAVAKFDDMDGASAYGYSTLLVLEGHHARLNI